MNIVPSTIQCRSCDYSGVVLEAHHGYKWWMLPFGFLLACTGIGLIPVAIIFILLGNRKYHACPKCMGREFVPWMGRPTVENNEIWKQAKEADENSFKKNKLLLLSVVMVMLAAAIVFMFFMMQSMYV